MSQSSSMTLQVLGSGAAFSRRYGTTCSVLTMPSGDRWLIDCGRQAPEQLAGAGLGWHGIAGQLVTHVRGDEGRPAAAARRPQRGPRRALGGAGALVTLPIGRGGRAGARGAG